MSEEGSLVEVIVHGPSSKAGKEALAKKVASFHAQMVLEYISRLHCPKEQKLALIDAILEQIREDNRKVKEGESLSP